MNTIDYGGVLGGGDMLLYEFSLKFVIWAPKKLFFLENLRSFEFLENWLKLPFLSPQI